MTAPMSSFRKAELRMLADSYLTGSWSRGSSNTNLENGLSDALDEIDRLETALKECDDERRTLLSMGSHILGVSGGTP